jgi:hypothetical protein
VIYDLLTKQGDSLRKLHQHILALGNPRAKSLRVGQILAAHMR